MKKILLVGKFNTGLEKLNGYLSKQFEVQLCSDSMELVRGMMKITRPNLIMVCITNTTGVNEAFLDELERSPSPIPVMVVGTLKECAQYKDKYKNGKFFFVSIPIPGMELVKKCNEILNKSESGGKNVKSEGKESRPDAQEAVSDTKKEEETEKKQLLVVDDSALMLRNIKNLLGSHYHVFIANSGEQALSVMMRIPFDLVLLDYDMPGWSGKKTLEKIREIPELKKIPVIFLTGITDKESITSVLRLNPAGYLLKPIEKEKLIKMIDQILAKV